MRNLKHRLDAKFPFQFEIRAVFGEQVVAAVVDHIFKIFQRFGPVNGHLAGDQVSPVNAVIKQVNPSEKRFSGPFPDPAGFIGGNALRQYCCGFNQVQRDLVEGFLRGLLVLVVFLRPFDGGDQQRDIFKEPYKFKMEIGAQELALGDHPVLFLI